MRKEAVCVLAGGKGKRIGREKRNLLLCGRTLLERALEIARGTGLPVLVTAKETLDIPGAEFLEDSRGEGPIAGLFSCLERCHKVVLLPCDMPFLTSELLLFLLGKAEGGDILVCEGEGRLQPQVGIYSRSCLPVAERNIERGEFSLRALVEEHSLKVKVVSEEELKKFGHVRRLLLNLNTEEDLRRAEEWLNCERRII